jgi:hypothetical protein
MGKIFAHLIVLRLWIRPCFGPLATIVVPFTELLTDLALFA